VRALSRRPDPTRPRDSAHLPRQGRCRRLQGLEARRGIWGRRREMRGLQTLLRRHARSLRESLRARALEPPLALVRGGVNMRSARGGDTVVLRLTFHVMAGLDARKSDVSDLRSRSIARKSGTPDFRCHPRLSLRVCGKTWMAGIADKCTQSAQA